MNFWIHLSFGVARKDHIERKGKVIKNYIKLNVTLQHCRFYETIAYNKSN